MASTDCAEWRQEEAERAADLRREARITAARITLQTSHLRAERVAAFEELKRLHAERSPAQIARMEQARGLR